MVTSVNGASGARHISVYEATVHTARVEIKTLTVSG